MSQQAVIGGTFSGARILFAAVVIYGFFLVVGPVWPSSSFLAKGGRTDVTASVAGTERSFAWDYDLRNAAATLFHLDAEKGKAMLQESLPVSGHAELEVPARFGWRHTLRSYIYMILGFDINQPRSLITASLPEKPIQREERYEPAGDVDELVGLKAPAASPQAPIGPGPQVSGMEQDKDMNMPDIPADDRGPLLAALQQRQWGRDPLVLIYHTHTSEMYDCRNTDLAVTSHVFNTTDTGVVRVGEELAHYLSRRYNIPVIHSKAIHDFPSFAQAYANSAKNVADILKRYPSIQVVLDIHRDGAENVSFSRELNDIRLSQVMLVLTRPESYKVSLHPDWWKNVHFGNTMAQKMEEIHPGLLRRVLEVGHTRYNQHLHPNMVLLEVGNYLDKEEEALNSARLLADVVAAMLADVLDPSYQIALQAKDPKARPAAVQAQSGTGIKKPVTPPANKPQPSTLPTATSPQGQSAGSGPKRVEPPNGNQVLPPAEPRPTGSLSR